MSRICMLQFVTFSISLKLWYLVLQLEHIDCSDICLITVDVKREICCFCKNKETLLFYDERLANSAQKSAMSNLWPFNGQACLKWPGGAWEIWHGTNFILSTLNQVQPRSPNWISRADKVDNVNWVIAGGTGAVQLDQGKAPGARPFWPRDASHNSKALFTIWRKVKQMQSVWLCILSPRGSEAIWVLQAIFISSFAKR